MGDIFEAQAGGVEGFERLVALKRLHSRVSENSRLLNAFVVLTKRAAQITHANVAILDLGHAGGNYFVEMELVRGRSLEAVLRRARSRGIRVPMPVACHFVMGMCEALHHAHGGRDRDPLLHGDLSPGSVLIEYEGDVKLVDFGVARAAAMLGGLPAEAAIRKSAYMSPEQVRGLPIDHRSDLFVVGALLHELLTGQRLFAGADAAAMMAKVRRVDVMPPSVYDRRLPAALDHIVLRTLAPETRDRPPDVMELHEVLRSCLFDAGILSPRTHARAFMRELFELPFEEGASPPVLDLDWDDDEMRPRLPARRRSAGGSPAEDPWLRSRRARQETVVRRRTDSCP